MNGILDLLIDDERNDIHITFTSISTHIYVSRHLE